jgi:hypothetical protein
LVDEVSGSAADRSGTSYIVPSFFKFIKTAEFHKFKLGENYNLNFIVFSKDSADCLGKYINILSFLPGSKNV